MVLERLGDVDPDGVPERLGEAEADMVLERLGDADPDGVPERLGEAEVDAVPV